MSNIQTNETNKSGKQKKYDLRIDFTPMVDLGFLLITFFMLTTSLSKPYVMPLLMPHTKDLPYDAQEIKASKILNLILDAENKVHYYEGLDIDSMTTTDFSADGLRRMILEKKKKVRGIHPDIEKTNADGSTRFANQLYVLIKPLSGSIYRNTVDVLDEMAICGVTYYSIIEAHPFELEKLSME